VGGHGQDEVVAIGGGDEGRRVIFEELGPENVLRWTLFILY